MFKNLKGIAIIAIPEGADPHETLLAALAAINDEGLPNVVTLGNNTQSAGINLYSLADLIRKCSGMQIPNIHVLKEQPIAVSSETINTLQLLVAKLGYPENREEWLGKLFSAYIMKNRVVTQAINHIRAIPVGSVDAIHLSEFKISDLREICMRLK